MSVYLLGEVALWVGLGLALYGAILGHVGGRRGDPRLVDAALGSVYGTATCVAFAYLLLTAGFLNDEFRLAYVADNASRGFIQHTQMLPVRFVWVRRDARTGTAVCGVEILADTASAREAA